MSSVSKGEFDSLQLSLALGHQQEADALASALLRQHHDPLSECLVRGLMFLADGNATEAYKTFFQASTIAPDDARCYLGIAQSLYQLGHFQKAIAGSQQALRLDPANWQAALVIADSLAAMAQWTDAIAHYNAILAMGVASAFVHLGLGTALARVGRLTDACEQFTHAIRLEPSKSAGYCNLGHAQMLLGQHREAIRLFRQTLPLTSVPDVVHANLALAYFAIDDVASAEAESRNALAINPDNAPAHGALADALRKQGRHGESVSHFQKHGTPESAAKALEALYHMGDMNVFRAAQDALSEKQPDNIRLAAIGALAGAQHGARYASRFSADPLAQISVRDIRSKLEPFGAFSAQLLDEVQALDHVWNPPAKTTKGGFQTEGNLFDLANPAVARLEAVIRDSIAEYFAAQTASTDRYVTHRPQDFTLTGWVVRLRKSGKQDPHIHPDGWLSGVLYLALPPRTGNEGAIAFTLGQHYFTPGSAVKADRLHQPQVGELVLFPSSLFHYTVPFSADEERVSVAFDLIPARI